MILSVSRRTDIPALYSDWFFNRLKDGFVLVPSPMIANGKVAKIELNPVKIETNLLGGKEVSGNIDGIVFWTKNPKPMMSRLNELKDFKYIFLFTLTPYDAKIEKDVPPVSERIKTFQELSQRIGADKVVWRYDPILLSKEIDVNWHIEQFENLAKKLQGFTTNCKISFLIGKHKDIHTPNFTERNILAENLSRISKQYGIKLESCAEEIDLDKYDIGRSKCIDPHYWEKLLNAKVKTKKKDGTRKNCGCMPCVDIGIYNTCTHNCLYCYANGFYGYRGEPKSMLDKIEGETYDRKTERIFEY